MVYKISFQLLEEMANHLPESSVKKQTKIYPVLIASIASSLSSFVFGFSLGYPSPIEEEVKRMGVLDDFTFPIFSSCLFFFAAIGSVAVSFFTERLGGKALIIILALINTLGWLLINSASGYHWEVMVSGRAVSGMAIGGSSALVSVYISDLAPKQSKGFYGSIFQHAFITGVLCSHLLGAFVSFRWLALVPVVALLMQSLILSWQPYSPKWLASRGLEKDAYNTLKYLRGPNYDCQSEYEEMARIIKAASGWTVLQRIRSLFLEMLNLRIIVIISIVFIGVELTGVSIVASYSSTNLKSSRLLSPNVASFIPTCTQSISVALFTFIVDRIGREPLLLFSGAVIALCHVILSAYSFGSSHVWSQCADLETTSSLTNSTGMHTLVHVNVQFCDYISLVPMGALILFRFAYGLGWGPIPYILLGESFPTKIRSIAASVAFCVYMLTIALMVLAFPYLEQLIGAHYVFTLFVVLNISTCVFVFLFIPETKGLSMEEVEGLFKGRIIFVKCLNPFHRKNVYFVEV